MQVLSAVSEGCSREFSGSSCAVQTHGGDRLTDTAFQGRSRLKFSLPGARALKKGSARDPATPQRRQLAIDRHVRHRLLSLGPHHEEETGGAQQGVRT